MGDRRCCCACPKFQDDFNRPNSTDLGDDWSESGDWDIYGQELRLASGSSGLVICQQQPQGQKISFYVRAKVVTLSDGSTWRIVVNYKDVDNYHFVALNRVNSTTGTLKLYRHEASGNVELRSCNFVPQAQQTFTACMESPDAVSGYSSFSATLSGGSVRISKGVLPIALGYKAGLGGTLNAGGDPILFDDFYFSEHYSTNLACPWCFCTCKEGNYRREISPLLHLNVHGNTAETAYCSKVWDGQVIELYNSVECFDGAGETYWEPGLWKGFMPNPGSDCPGVGSCLDELAATLTCAGAANAVDNYRLYTSLSDVYQVPNGNSTCDPFYLEFDELNFGKCSPSGGCIAHYGKECVDDNVVWFTVTA